MNNLLKFAFHLLYNQLAWTYDWVSWIVSRGDWRGWQRAALPFVRGPRVLELAHGPGHMLIALSRAGYRVTGLDLSPAMSRQAQRRLHRLDIPVPLLRGRAQALPLANQQFDTVLATFPTDFVIDPRTLSAVARVLAPNGQFVIVPEGQLLGRDPLTRAIEWLYRVTGQHDGSDPTDPKQQAQRWRPWETRFSAAGFTLTAHVIDLPRSRATVLVATQS